MRTWARTGAAGREGCKSRRGPVCIIDCGLAEYRQVLARQHELRKRRSRDEIADTVLLVEHPPVVTLGVRRSANRLLVDRSELRKRKIDLVEIRRGGGATAHNPGQLVFYPILDLRHQELGISDYVRRLERIGIELLDRLGVEAERRRGLPGLWVGQKKIASIGVRVSKFITYHGMAININNDLGIFELFVPCGLDGVRMTSVLEQTGRRHPMSKVKDELIGLLQGHLGAGQ